MKDFFLFKALIIQNILYLLFEIAYSILNQIVSI